MPRQQNFKSLKIGEDFVPAKNAKWLETLRNIRVYRKSSERHAKYIAEHRPGSESRYWYTGTKTFASDDKVVKI